MCVAPQLYLHNIITPLLFSVVATQLLQIYIYKLNQ